MPEEKRPVGHWGRLHQAYLRMYRPGFYNELVLSCKLHTYLADLNEQATERCSLIIEQMAEAEGVDESAVRHSIERGLQNMKKYLEKVL